MPSQDEELVKILNDLVAACRDAEEGYAKAAKGAHNREVGDRLTALSGERSTFADEISRIVSDMGAKPAREAHFGGILHRGWVDLETRLRSKDDAEMLRECRLGDQETLNHYQDALERAPQMPSETGVIIERHRNTIRSEIDSLRKSGANRQYGASR
jgi:uncharacterized protein (TIGR02284 family)